MQLLQTSTDEQVEQLLIVTVHSWHRKEGFTAYPGSQSIQTVEEEQRMQLVIRLEHKTHIFVEFKA